jgi:type I restriction enzyme M protein
MIAKKRRDDMRLIGLVTPLQHGGERARRVDFAFLDGERHKRKSRRAVKIARQRLDCILEASKPAVLAAEKSLPEGIDDETRDMILFGAAGDNIRVYNTSRFTFTSLKGQDPGQLHDNLIDYIIRFSPNVRDIFLDKFRFTEALKRLKDGGILWQVFVRFCAIDLHPNKVSNIEMGYLFEDLIRRFSEISNETAGEHFTQREVIRLIVELLLAHDHAALTGTGIIRTVYDPACGTGGMLALTEEAMMALNPKIRVELFGQELNGESLDTDEIERFAAILYKGPLDPSEQCAKGRVTA